MRKSSTLALNYRPGTSRPHLSVASFRDQMTDYARGDVLRELRDGLQPRKSREAVAHEIGVSTKTLYTWEQKNGGIKWTHAQALGLFYGRDPESLVTRDPEAAGPPTRVEFRANIEEFRGDIDGIKERLEAIEQGLGAAVEGLREQYLILGKILDSIGKPEATRVLEEGARQIAELAQAEAEALAAPAAADAGKGHRQPGA